jgi:hypothetical protein
MESQGSLTNPSLTGDQLSGCGGQALLVCTESAKFASWCGCVAISVFSCVSLLRVSGLQGFLAVPNVSVC